MAEPTEAPEVPGVSAFTPPDIDGLIVIGTFPLVAHVDRQRLYMDKIQEARFSVRSLSTRDYDHKYKYSIATVSGMPVSVVTDLPPHDFRILVASFLAEAKVGEAGQENNWLVHSCSTAAAVNDRMREMARFDVVVDQTFYDAFTQYAPLAVFRKHGPEVMFKAGIFWYGMKKGANAFESNLRTIIRPHVELLNVHVGTESQPVPGVEEPLLIALTADAKIGNTTKGLWFSPLASPFAASASLSAENKICLAFGEHVPVHVQSLRFYNPTLSYARSHAPGADRNARCVIASAALAGGVHVHTGPYKRLVQQGKHCATVGAAALSDVQTNGARLRVEVVIEDRELTLTKIRYTHRKLLEFLETEEIVCMFKLNESTVFDSIDRTVHALTDLRPSNVGPLTLAEAFFGLLVDGGTNRIQYDALKLSLDGKTVGEALLAAEAEDHFIQPIDFTGVSNRVLYKCPKIHRDIAKQLRVPEAAVEKLIRLPRLMPARTASNDIERLRAVLKMVMVLEMVRCQSDCTQLFHRQFHIGNKRMPLMGTITPYELAKCLLKERAKTGLRALQVTVLHVHFEGDHAGKSEHARVAMLATAIASTKDLEAFPHSTPKAYEDRKDRCAKSWNVHCATCEE